MTEREVWGTSENFHDWLQGLTLEMTKRYRRRDVRGMKAILKNLGNIEPDIRDENYRSSYSTTTARCVLQLAEATLDQLKFEPCIQLCERAKRILDNKMERRAELRMSYRPDTLAWANLGRVLADAKWKGAEALRDSVFTPAQLIDSYYGCEKQLHEGLIDQPQVDDRKRRDCNENMLWFAVLVIKTAMRYEPDTVNDIVDYCELYHDDALYDIELPFYHDLEFARMFFNKALTHRLGIMLHANRRKTLRKMKGRDFDLKAYDASSSRERDFLLGKEPVRFEITRPTETRSSA